jgi:hypothetical protein
LPSPLRPIFSAGGFSPIEDGSFGVKCGGYRVSAGRVIVLCVEKH